MGVINRSPQSEATYRPNRTVELQAVYFRGWNIDGGHCRSAVEQENRNCLPILHPVVVGGDIDALGHSARIALMLEAELDIGNLFRFHAVATRGSRAVQRCCGSVK